VGKGECKKAKRRPAQLIGSSVKASEKDRAFLSVLRILSRVNIGSSPVGRASLLLVLVTALLIPTSAQGQQNTQPAFQCLGFRSYRDILYVPNGTPRQNLDLYVPVTTRARLPLIVWIHGGGWTGGSKDPCAAVGWANRGYVVASINYRLSRRARFPAQIEDCKAAVCWLRRHADSYGIDPDRVVAWGESAGGHLASLLGTAGYVPAWEEGDEEGSSRVQAVIDWYGRADLTAVSTDLALAGSASALLLGGSGDAVAELAQEASPILHISKDDPPFLIMHGDKDNIVPLKQSERFANALKLAGVKVKMLVLKGAGHGGPEFMQSESMKVIETFLDETLLNSKNRPDW
jgi:acetyl esterase/lipase